MLHARKTGHVEAGALHCLRLTSGPKIAPPPKSSMGGGTTYEVPGHVWPALFVLVESAFLLPPKFQCPGFSSTVSGLAQKWIVKSTAEPNAYLQLPPPAGGRHMLNLRAFLSKCWPVTFAFYVFLAPSSNWHQAGNLTYPFFPRVNGLVLRGFRCGLRAALSVLSLSQMYACGLGVLGSFAAKTGKRRGNFANERSAQLGILDNICYTPAAGDSPCLVRSAECKNTETGTIALFLWFLCFPPCILVYIAVGAMAFDHVSTLLKKEGGR
eukprot:1292853-Amphidinium_carterae.1